MGSDGGGGRHDRCHQPQTPKSGCLEVGIVVRNTVLPRGGADEDAHRQLHLVHRLHLTDVFLQVCDRDLLLTFSYTLCGVLYIGHMYCVALVYLLFLTSLV